MKTRIIIGDVTPSLRKIERRSVHCVVTSPPYWGLRDYGVKGQIGNEPTPDEYVQNLVKVFRKIRRVLRDDGTVWLNMGDSYANSGPGSWGSSSKSTLTTGSRKGAWAPGKTIGTTPVRRIPPGLKPKDLVGVPWRVAFALQADGWYLRSDIIWSKPNPMPESITDRPTKSHEYIFLFSKSQKYFYDHYAIKEPSLNPESYRPRRPRSPDKREGDPHFATKVGNHADGKVYPTRNKRSVWIITVKPYREAHFSVFPPELPEVCIKAGTSEHGCCISCGAPYEKILRRKKRIIWSPTCHCKRNKPVPCTVLDPFAGSGTTGAVAKRLGRNSVLIELNRAYLPFIKKRIRDLG